MEYLAAKPWQYEREINIVQVGIAYVLGDEAFTGQGHGASCSRDDRNSSQGVENEERSGQPTVHGKKTGHQDGGNLKDAEGPDKD